MQQLTGKRQRGLRQLQAAAERLSNLKVTTGDIGLAAFEGGNLLLQLPVLITQMLQLYTVLNLLVLQISLIFFQRIQTIPGLLAVSKKTIVVYWRTQFKRPANVQIVVTSLGDTIALAAQALQFGFQFRQPLATVLIDAALQLPTGDTQFVDGQTQLLQPPFQLLLLLLPAGNALSQQGNFFIGKVAVQRLTAVAQGDDTGLNVLMLIAVGNQWCQPINLLTRLEHRFMGAIEIIKLTTEFIDFLLGIGALKHMAADKVRQVAHGFHGHCLIKQLQSLIILNAHLTTKLSLILAKTVKEFYLVQSLELFL